MPTCDPAVPLCLVQDGEHCVLPRPERYLRVDFEPLLRVRHFGNHKEEAMQVCVRARELQLHVSLHSHQA
jgi:hypothetical protein